MINIQPQYLPLTRLLTRRLFTIPDYQRAYSWTSHQRNDLFNDIEKTFAKGSDQAHFMAAIVALRRRTQTLGTDEFDVMEIVDGQQRLTTIIILLNAIRFSVDSQDTAQRKLEVELSDLLVKTEGEELLLLQTNHDSSHYFASYLRKGVAPQPNTAQTLADTELLNAISECSAFVKSWVSGGKPLTTLFALLKNRLFFLLHEIEDEKTVYTVFEVLNSRGLDVSWIDRLKSILMGAAFELTNANNATIISDLHTIWRDIYSTIGLRQGMSTEALRFAATLRTNQAPSRALSQEDSVDLLRAKATSATEIREVAHWLLKVTNAYERVAESVRIEAVARISQARLLAIAIHLQEEFDGGQRQRLLSRWEKVSFRIYGMLGNDARTGVGDFVRLAWKVVNEKMSFDEVDQQIGNIGMLFSIEGAINALRDVNCYEGWESELRYLMFRYEEHLAEAQGLKFRNEQWEKIWMSSPSESIEHILPQSRASDKQRHRLGNLVLLPPRLNSTLQDISPKEKVDAYRKTGLLIANEVADMIEDEGWKPKSIDAREEKILLWASKEWAD